MTEVIKIAVDAMGGDGSPKKLSMVLIIIFLITEIHFIKFLETMIKFKNLYLRL